MNRSIVTLLLTLPACSALLSCASPPRDAGTRGASCGEYVAAGPAVEQIRALEEAGAASNVKGMSRDQAERMFAPGYVTLGQDGSVTRREKMLSNWKSEPWASLFTIKELEIRVYCDTGIVVGLSEALPLGAPEGIQPRHFRWLNVWTASNGEWRLSATQFTRF